MLRYMRRLADRDLALDRSMIPLGSCTMKLNATAEMIPLTWPEFSDIHPFAPADQAARLRGDDRRPLRQSCARSRVTTLSRCSQIPARRANMRGCLPSAPIIAAAGQAHRNVCLIPASAHGTNPASAHMAGMNVVVVSCDAQRQCRSRRLARPRPRNTPAQPRRAS